MKKIICLVLALSMVFSFVACQPAANPTAPATTVPATDVPATDAPATDVPATTVPATDAPADGDIFIAVEAKGFQHQFWQTVNAGATAAAEQYGVKMEFQGPEGESAIPTQIEQLNALLAKNPQAICLAALDTKSVTDQLNQAKENNIPVIGFDSGVPDAPEGTIAATASTNNEVAGALGADEMFKAEKFAAALEKATPEAPVRIACLSQEAVSASIVGRTTGFVNKMAELCEAKFAGKVSIEGHDTWAKPVDGAAVIIDVQVPATPDDADMKSGAQQIFGKDDLIAVFGSNEGAARGILAATADGTELETTYKDITVVGFDAGANQKMAVEKGWFFGAVTQDPYRIGFLAVELAYKAIKGEAVADVDTGCKFYTAANMKDEDIAQLLYD